MKAELSRYEALPLEKANDLSIRSKDMLGKQQDVALLDRPIMADQQKQEKFPSISRTDYLDKPIQLKQEDAGETKPRVIMCLNSGLEGARHPITDVPFERVIVLHKGEKIEGVFPRFDSKCDVKLPEHLYEAKNKTQFDYANEELRERVKTDPALQTQFNGEQLEQIRNGDRPDGYVWHHSEKPGQLQLVGWNVHDGTAHTGGQAIWGGGKENR